VHGAEKSLNRARTGLCRRYERDPFPLLEAPLVGRYVYCVYVCDASHCLNPEFMDRSLAS
jgi:hypothetical protein